VKCVFRCAESQLPLPAQTSLALFRIAQEAIHNAIVRGGANRIELELAITNGRITLAIRDDGKGFDPSKKAGSGMGLRLMQYRAHSINATFQLSSQPGAGTLVQCSLPVESPDPAPLKSPGQE
jgi:signal transduction histidine kinase